MSKKTTAFVSVEIDGAEPPATVKRTGKDSSGGDYSLTISVAGLSIDGQEIPNELGAAFIADRIEEAFKRAKPAAKRKAKKSK